MAERRMFAKQIVLSDAFLDLPATARCLYFTLAMSADDDGFVNAPKSVMRLCGSSQDDMRVLIGKEFLISFDSGVVVIKHWKAHNYIPKDRYKPTACLAEKAQVELGSDGIYRLVYRMDTDCIQSVYTVDTDCIQSVYTGKDRLGKDSIGKDSIEKKRTRFAPPSLNDILEYCSEKGISIDGEAFIDYYSQQDWKLSNGNKMKNWQSAVNNWYRRQEEWKSKKKVKTDNFNDFDQRTYDDDLEGRLLDL